MKQIEQALTKRIEAISDEDTQRKQAMQKACGFIKRAYIEKQDCEQSDGTKGSYVVKSHESGEQLGCFTSKEAAENYLQAAHAKSSSLEKEAVDKDLIAALVGALAGGGLGGVAGYYQPQLRGAQPAEDWTRYLPMLTHIPAGAILGASAGSQLSSGGEF